MATSLWLRVAVVQFAPKLGEVHANIAKARELCRGLTPRSIDLVCFPEMIFSGYMFPDAPSIASYLEHPQTGPTSSFCAALARDLQCYVVAGFPERLEPGSSHDVVPGPCPPSDPSATATAVVDASPAHASAHDHGHGHGRQGANAAVLFDSTGRRVHAYHKSNLFSTDRPWARAGPGFTALDLPGPFGRTALAICNDLNPHDSGDEGDDADGDGAATGRSIELGPYELAGFCRRESVRVLVLLNAWLKPVEDGGDDGDEDDGASDGGLAEDDNGDEGNDDGREPNWAVLNYWAWRLQPLWAREFEPPRTAVARSSPANVSEEQDDVVVVVCNRFGRERGKVFAGSSAMFAMRRGTGKPRLLHFMGEREEGVCVWTTQIKSHVSA